MRRINGVRILVFVLVMLAGSYWSYLAGQVERETQISLLHEISGVQANSIERRLIKSLAATYILAHEVRVKNGDFSGSDFDSYAMELIKRVGGISNLQLAPAGIVSSIYPLEGNERALGHDILRDDKRKAEARNAVEENELTLAGPFTLVQGGVAVIGRNPVFINRNGTDFFWGFTSVLIYLDDLLSDSELGSLAERGYSYRMSREDPVSGEMSVFASSLQLDDTKELTVTHDIHVPNAIWKLQMSLPETEAALPLGYMASVLGALLLAWLGGRVYAEPVRLRQLVERKTQALSLREAQLRDLIEALPSGILVTDGDGRAQLANQRYADIFDVSMKIGELTQPAAERFVDGERFPESLKAMMEQGIAVKSMLLVDSNGSEYELDYAPVVGDAEERLHLWNYRDVTQRRKAEELMRKISAERESIFQLSPDAFASFDALGHIRQVNKAFEVAFGINSEAIVGLHCSDLDRQLAALCENESTLENIDYAAHLANRDDHDGTLLVDELRLARPETRYLQRLVRFEATEKSLGGVIYFRDMTKQKELEQMKTEFLSTAAHELRTPMTAIYGYTELLLHADYDSKMQKELLTSVYRQTSRLVSMVDDLLDLARIESRGALEFKLERQELLPLVQMAVHDISLAGGPGHEFELTIADSLPEAVIDADKISQVMMNILSNAQKYSPQGAAIQVSVDTCIEEEQRMLQVKVRDQGIGMSEVDLKHIFTRFYRADKSGSIPGTGLGMSIAWEIIALHHGSIEVQSEPGKGTMVTVKLPCVSEPALA
uniref:ATP-binding protein n=1 Tax=Marinobacterium profundum TaxID=1714300 RepID=UPI000830AC37|nr:ATP-binding protein [Marinobacterium profundum]